MVKTFWKVFGLFLCTGVGGLLGMKHQYELEEQWSKQFSQRVRLELEKEIEKEQIVEKIMEAERARDNEVPLYVL